MAEFVQAHGDTISILILIAGIAWRASSRLTALESAVAHDRELLQQKDESILAELRDHKDRSQKNFDRLYTLVQNGKKE